MNIQLIITGAFIACGIFTFLRLLGGAREVAVAQAQRRRGPVPSAPTQTAPKPVEVPEVMGYDADE